MSNVIHFPIQRKEVRSDLKELAGSLKSSYDDLDEIWEILDALEKDIADVESMYNQKIIELAQISGAESITMEDLEFATNLAVTMTDEGLTFKILDEDENEISFTPDFNLEIEDSGEKNQLSFDFDTEE